MGCRVPGAESRHNTDEALATAIDTTADRAGEEISRAERLKARLGRAARAAGSLGVTHNDVKLSIDPAALDGTSDLARRLFDLVELCVESGRGGFVLLLDEAQVVRDGRDRGGEHPLSLLISAVAALQRKDLPLGLVLCGLPTLTGNLLRARSYTERMFRGEEIGRLAADEATAAFIEPLRGRIVVADGDLVSAVVHEVEGYPYFIQLWGAELWDAADAAEVTLLDEQLLELTTDDIYRRLDIDFYEPRVSTLTPAEQDVLLATAACPYPPLATVDLNEAVDKTPGNINVLLGRLVEAGVLYRIRKGQYEYTAPKFREYLLRRTVDGFERSTPVTGALLTLTSKVPAMARRPGGRLVCTKSWRKLVQLLRGRGSQRTPCEPQGVCRPSASRGTSRGDRAWRAGRSARRRRLRRVARVPRTRGDAHAFESGEATRCQEGRASDGSRASR